MLNNSINLQGVIYVIEIVCIKPKTSKISYIKIEEDNLEYIENTGNG